MPLTDAAVFSNVPPMAVLWPFLLAAGSYFLLRWVIWGPGSGWRYELVRGELRKMSPSGSRHAIIAARIITSLGQYVEKHGLGAAGTCSLDHVKHGIHDFRVFFRAPARAGGASLLREEVANWLRRS